MKDKFELIVDERKETITSLELLEGINYLRELEYKTRQADNTLTQVQIKRGKSVRLKHKNLLETIRDELDEEFNEQKILPVEYIDKKGELRPMYILTLEQSKQVLLRESKYVRRKILKYIKQLEEELRAKKSKKSSDWLQTRLESKIVRRKVTDIIKELIPYAIRQGSKNTKFFYSNYSKLANKTAGIENGTRDKVSMMELNRVAEIENIFTKLIEKCMDKEIPYKEIYQICKRKGEELKKVFEVDLIG
jgi:hypothetical protein fuD12_10907|nr:MAG TPA: regulatory protein [Herelleviridae sp.]